MHRHIVYPGSIPLDTDLLNAIKDAYYGLGWLAESMIGVSTAIVGLAVTPTAPASLQVNVAPGAIYSLQTVDQSAYGSLGTDANQFVKQGILAASTTLTLTPPATTGQSINYLVQVAFSETDANPVVLPYYNAANPSVAWSGPNNTGTAQNTVRKDSCVVQLKAGSPAATGSQTTPAPDAGYIGIYVITVANGASVINSGNITLLNTAPFFTPLPQIPAGVQNSLWISAVDSGTATALVVALTPAPAAYTKFMMLEVQVANTAVGAATINVNGLGAKPIVDRSGLPAVVGLWKAGDILGLVYDGTSFRLVSGASSSPLQIAVNTATSRSVSNNTLTQVPINATSGFPFGSIASDTLTFARAGTYLVSVTLSTSESFTGPTNIGSTMSIRKNNIEVAGGYDQDTNYGNGSSSFTLGATVMTDFAVGDTMTVFAQVGASGGFGSGAINGSSINVVKVA